MQKEENKWKSQLKKGKRNKVRSTSCMGIWEYHNHGVKRQERTMIMGYMSI